MEAAFYHARKNRKQYRYVLKQLTGREIKRKYARSYLGILWSVLNPLLFMLVVTLVFSTIFHRDIENFPVYYMCGSTVYSMFTQGTEQALDALSSNRSMIFRTLLPKQIFIISRVYTALSNFLFSFAALLLVSAITGISFRWTILLWGIDLFALVGFILGIGYILSVLYVFFADVKYLYGIFVQLLYWLTPIFYPVERLHPVAQQIVKVNPMYAYVTFGRICLMQGSVPDPFLWLQILLWSISLFCLGYLIFKRYENDVIIRL